MDVAAWVQGLSLERFVPAVQDNESNWEVLPNLLSEDPRQIGVALSATCASCSTHSVPRPPPTAPSCDAPARSPPDVGRWR